MYAAAHITSLLAEAAFSFVFFFNDTATTEIYTLSLHDALPIWERPMTEALAQPAKSGNVASSTPDTMDWDSRARRGERKSTRLNSPHPQKSYARFFFEKKKKIHREATRGEHEYRP